MGSFLAAIEPIHRHAFIVAAEASPETREMFRDLVDRSLREGWSLLRLGAEARARNGRASAGPDREVSR